MWSLKVMGQKLLSLSCPQGLIQRVPKLTLTVDPVTQNQRVLPLIIHNLHEKFESDWAKTVVSIVPTMSNTMSAKDDHDLWPRDPISIGFLLPSSTTYMWSLKVIGQKLFSPTGERSIPKLCTSGEMLSHPKLSHPRVRQHFCTVI